MIKELGILLEKILKFSTRVTNNKTRIYNVEEISKEKTQISQY